MNEEKQELRYRQAGVAGTEWSVATTPDEFTQNGFLEIKVINDNGTLNFPFCFTGDDIAKLIVSDSGTNDRQQTSRVVVQTITVTPSGTNKSVTYTRTRRNVNGNQQWSSWVEPEAASTANIYDGSVTAGKLADDIRPNAVSPLRPLFIAAGAEYNDSGADKTKTAPWGETVIHKAGHYYLNGLGDITEKQMMDIYVYTYPFYNATDLTKAFRIQGNGKEVVTRTNLRNPNHFTGIGEKSILSLETVCYGNTVIEVFVVNHSKNTITVSGITNSFINASKLKAIVGYISLQQISTSIDLSYCSKLIFFTFHGLKSNINISKAEDVSKQSVLYLIQKAQPIAAITVSLHPDAYAHLAGDAEIVAALEAQPLISLVSA